MSKALVAVVKVFPLANKTSLVHEKHERHEKLSIIPTLQRWNAAVDAPASSYILAKQRWSVVR
jgi:hypothetical protein